MTTWTKENLEQFIKLLEQQECLWKVRSRDYSNRQKRETAYEVLVNFCKNFDQEIDVGKVKNKISNLRTVFRKEHKKASSIKSGAGTDEVYTPKLWYYKDLCFLREQEETLSGISSIELEESISNVESPQSPGLDAPPSSSDPGTSSIPRNFKRKREDTVIDATLKTINARLNEKKPEDEFDTVGKNIGNKLRNLPSLQRVIAEKLINDVLFEAQLGTLNRGSAIRVNTREKVEGVVTVEVDDDYSDIQYLFDT